MIYTHDIEHEGMLYSIEYTSKFEPYDEDTDYGGYHTARIHCVYIDLVGVYNDPVKERVLILYGKASHDSQVVCEEMQKHFNIELFEEFINEYINK